MPTVNSSNRARVITQYKARGKALRESQLKKYLNTTGGKRIVSQAQDQASQSGGVAVTSNGTTVIVNDTGYGAVAQVELKKSGGYTIQTGPRSKVLSYGRDNKSRDPNSKTAGFASALDKGVSPKEEFTINTAGARPPKDYASFAGQMVTEPTGVGQEEFDNGRGMISNGTLARAERERAAFLEQEQRRRDYNQALADADDPDSSVAFFNRERVNQEFDMNQGMKGFLRSYYSGLAGGAVLTLTSVARDPLGTAKSTLNIEEQYKFVAGTPKRYLTQGGAGLAAFGTDLVTIGLPTAKTLNVNKFLSGSVTQNFKSIFVTQKSDFLLEQRNLKAVRADIYESELRDLMRKIRGEKAQPRTSSFDVFNDLQAPDAYEFESPNFRANIAKQRREFYTPVVEENVAPKTKMSEFNEITKVIDLTKFETRASIDIKKRARESFYEEEKPLESINSAWATEEKELTGQNSNFARETPDFVDAMRVFSKFDSKRLKRLLADNNKVQSSSTFKRLLSDTKGQASLTVFSPRSTETGVMRRGFSDYNRIKDILDEYDRISKKNEFPKRFISKVTAEDVMKNKNIFAGALLSEQITSPIFKQDNALKSSVLSRYDEKKESRDYTLIIAGLSIEQSINANNKIGEKILQLTDEKMKNDEETVLEQVTTTTTNTNRRPRPLSIPEITFDFEPRFPVIPTIPTTTPRKKKKGYSIYQDFLDLDFVPSFAGVELGIGITRGKKGTVYSGIEARSPGRLPAYVRKLL